MNILRKMMMLLVSFLLVEMSAGAQSVFQGVGKGISYDAEVQLTASSGQSPLWLNANKYGLSSVAGDNGYIRAGLFRSTRADSARHWRIGYGLDLAAAYNFTGSFVVQQAYADFEYKKVRLSVGSKERSAEFKNPELSSGSQTLGINARPVPMVRFELPEYISLTGSSNWVGLKGHIGYGWMTDGRWQEDYVSAGAHYAKKALFHSKAGYLRIGNEEKFPLVFEGGLEMACLFGGTIYNAVGRTGVLAEPLQMGTGLGDIIDATLGTGSDATDGEYANAAGNTLGSWLLSLKYAGKDWSIRAYYDHYFEDHSQMFWEYGWRDGLIGAEVQLPKNRFVSSLVYEYLHTKHQSGPVYHDHTEAIPDQISAIDNYYNHNLYQGWQHWGQAFGNPLFTSPLYNPGHNLTFTGNRFIAHHFGLSGDPLPGLHYRLLYSYISGWGRYAVPFDDVKYTNSFLAEVSYALPRVGRVDLRGWSVKAAFALDRSTQIGNNTGFQLTISKTGFLTR